MSSFCVRGLTSPLASHMAAAQQDFIFAFSLCILTKLKRSVGPGEACKLSFHSYIVMYRLLTLAKTDAEICDNLPGHTD